MGQWLIWLIFSLLGMWRACGLCKPPSGGLMVLLANQAGLPALNDEMKAPRAFKRSAAQIAHPKAACAGQGLAIEQCCYRHFSL